MCAKGEIEREREGGEVVGGIFCSFEYRYPQVVQAAGGTGLKVYRYRSLEVVVYLLNARSNAVGVYNICQCR